MTDATPPSGRTPLRECLGLWAIAIAGIALAKWLLDPLIGVHLAGLPLIDGLFHPKTIAAVLFLYLPVVAMKRRDEYPEDYGLRFKALGRPLALFGWMAFATFPLYIAGYFVFVRVLPHLPPPLAHLLGPYGITGGFVLRWPDKFPLKILDQLLVVALPEEFFYRGYLQQRLKLQFGGGPSVFGVRLGGAFWLTQVLFALGHLVEPYPWRLAVFFPALLFGWLREKSGSLPAGILYHASCNLLVLVLEASFLERPDMRLTSFACLLLVACATAKPVPQPLPPDPATLPPLPRSSLSAVLEHRTELELTDEQARLIQRLDDHLIEENTALQAEAAKEPPPEPRKEEPAPDRSPIEDTSPSSGGMGMGMGGRGHHQAPVHPKAAPSKPVPQDKTVQQTMDDNDAEAYENAERSVLKAAQFDRAREIASKYREELFDRRDMAKRRAEAGK